MTPPIVQRLRDAAASLHAERVPMRAIAQAHGPAAQGTLLLMLAVPCLLPVPGVGTLLGMAMLALAVSMWRGHAAAGLPPRVADLEMSCTWARRVLGVLASTYAVAGRHARARLDHFACEERAGLTALAVGAMAVIVVLPIPFGNVLPSVALVLIGLGLVFRDGLAVLAGLAMSGVTVAVTAGALALAYTWGSGWVAAWLPG